MKGEIPVNTERSTTLAVKIFDDWRKAQNATVTTDLCPENIFTKKQQYYYISGSVNSYGSEEDNGTRIHST